MSGDVPPDLNYWYTQWLCMKGWNEIRDIPKRANRMAKIWGITEEESLKVYQDRLRLELKQIKDMRMIDYFLIVYDIYRFCRTNKIMVGPGRGSSAGSLVCYLLTITSIDPLEHKLLFERFLNKDRIDLPDIDMDFEDARRAEVIEYLHNHYGRDKTSQITTYSTLKGKACLKDVCRTLDIPHGEVNEITSSIVERSSGDERASQTISDSFDEFDVCKEFAKRHPQVRPLVTRLEGQVRNAGIHAAGVIIAPKPLWEYLPLETRKDSKTDRQIVVSAIDFWGSEAFGLIKLDVLGLKNLTVIRECLEYIEEWHGVKIDLEALVLDDPKVLQGFTNGDYTGIFQYDSVGMRKTTEKVKFTSFNDVAAFNALYRPGAMRSGLGAKYVRNKNDPSKIEKVHPIYDEICAPTMGVIVYQEQVSQIFVKVAGYAPSSADSLRKKIAKKFGDEEMNKERDKFVEGAGKNGMDAPTANMIMDYITFFGSYGFNLCISGNTLVQRAGANSSHKSIIAVSELFAAQFSSTPWGQKIRAGKLKLLQMDDDGRIRPGFLKAIHYNGRREVFQLLTKDGREIRATSNHKFMSENGYRPVSEFKVGDKIFAMGVDAKKKKGRQTDRAKNKTYKGLEGGLGTPEGIENPAYIDGRMIAFKKATGIVFKRSNGRCEFCGCKETDQDRFEYAHIKSLESCGGDYSKYHNDVNIKRSCNSCHKKFDYQKGERKKRWTKGRPVELDEIVSIESVGIESVYDVEMDTVGHNFIANGLLSHNSHAAAYGAIAYWEMMLKINYCLEFFCASFRNAKNDDGSELRRFIKEAIDKGIEVRAPDVNFSGANFNIAKEGEHRFIVSSLVDIKGVGGKAAEDIVAAQPFASFADFLKRVTRRIVNKRVIDSLARSGAFKKLIPNTKFFLENCERLLKMSPEAAEKEINDSANLPNYSEEELQIIMSEVCPVQSGQHKIEMYYETLKHFWIGEDWTPLDQGKIFQKKFHYIRGVIVDLRYNQVGDFHSGDAPDADTQAKKGWGKRYANINVEDETGTQHRMKVDYDIFEDFRKIIDKGVGTPVCALVSTNAQYQAVQVCNLVDLESVRLKFLNKEPLNYWEQYFMEHPGKSGRSEYQKQQAEKGKPIEKLIRTSMLAGVKKESDFFIVATIVKIKNIWDKKGQKMGFVTMADETGTTEFIVFGSSWAAFDKRLKHGNTALFKLSKDKKNTLILDHEKGVMKILSGAKTETQKN